MLSYIGIGSNLADPVKQVQSAIKAIGLIPHTLLIARSSLYSSPPMGPQDQPDYINAVVSVETSLEPHALLEALQQIEQEHGRERKRHWGERTLDLDILLYEDRIISDERLSVPHPGIAERAFVIYPLIEIAPNLCIPTLGLISELSNQCPLDGLKRIES